MSTSKDQPRPTTKEVENPSRVVQNTSLYTTYFRSFSDIPHAAQFARMVRAKEAVEQDKKTLGPLDTKIPFFEARYKAIDALIKLNKIDQVVEFAAGRSLRGINNQQWNYVHTDQDGDALKAMWLFGKSVVGKAGKMPSFVEFDAITGNGFENITSCLNGQRVAVIHEGLYTYYPHATKGKIATQARRLLEIYGGLYITPDVHLQADMVRWYGLEARTEEQKRALAEKFNRDLESFHFKDRAEGYSFFGELGFNARVYPLGYLVGELSSTKKLFTDPNRIGVVDQVTKSMGIWKMSLRRDLSQP